MLSFYISIDTNFILFSFSFLFLSLSLSSSARFAAVADDANWVDCLHNNNAPTPPTRVPYCFLCAADFIVVERDAMMMMMISLQRVIVQLRYHHWNHYCVKISRDVYRREQIVVLHVTAMDHRRWRHRLRIAQEYAIVQIRWLCHLNRLFLRQMVQSHRRALITIRSFSGRVHRWRREIYYAHIVALNFPIRPYISFTRDVTPNRILGNATSARRHAPMSTNLTHICWAKAINEALSTPSDTITFILTDPRTTRYDTHTHKLRIKMTLFLLHHNSSRWRKILYIGDNIHTFFYSSSHTAKMMCDWPKWQDKSVDKKVDHSNYSC